MDPEAVAQELGSRARLLPDQSVRSLRALRREYSRLLRRASGDQAFAVADALVERYRWLAYELLYHHPAGVAGLDLERVERLGRGLDDWGSVDAFGRFVSGPAWLRLRIPDVAVRFWAASPDRWWRRVALVSTVALNLRSAGGGGDAARTLDICDRLASDRDDMVVKALSWALRELVVWDPGAVRDFLASRRSLLAPRVQREVTSKLETGLKRMPPGATG